jgi:hypothetical protein
MEVKAKSFDPTRLNIKLENNNWNKFKRLYLAICYSIGVEETNLDAAGEDALPSTKEFKKSWQAAYSLLATHISDELDHLVFQHPTGDLLSCWKSIKAHFHGTSRGSRRNRRNAFNNMTMQPTGQTFSRYAALLRIERDDINEAYGDDEKERKISDAELIDALIEGVSKYHHSTFESIITIMDESKDDMTYNEIVNKMLPIAQKAGLEGEGMPHESNFVQQQQHERAYAMDDKYIYGRIRNPHLQPCYNYFEQGECSFGDKCRYSHSSTQNPSLRPQVVRPPPDTRLPRIARRDDEHKKSSYNPPSQPTTSRASNRVIRCGYCKVRNHHANNCPKKKKDEARLDKMVNAAEQMQKALAAMQLRISSADDGNEAASDSGEATDHATTAYLSGEEQEEEVCKYDYYSESSDYDFTFVAEEEKKVKNSRFSGFPRFFYVTSFILTISHWINLSTVVSLKRYLLPLSLALLALLALPQVYNHDYDESTDKGYVLSASHVPKSFAIDSGATIHLVGDKSLFLPGSTSAADVRVKVANGKVVRSTLSGDVLLESVDDHGALLTLPLKKAYYIPGLSKNLVSVPQLDKKDYRTVMENGICVITDSKSKKRVLFAWLHSLYEVCPAPEELHLTLDNNSTLEYMTPPKLNNLQLWHHRLGHRSEEYCRKVIPGIPKSDRLGFCEVCARAKLKKKGFSRMGTPHNKASKPAEHLCTDTCEMPTVSIQGNKYFGIVMCLHSRFSYFIAMSSKTQFVTKFSNLLTHLWNRFSRYPAFLRSDQGTEYDNNAMQQLCEEKGIEFTMSTTQNPNQNSHAENRIQRSLSCIRSMLTHSGHGPSYWQYAGEYSVYIDNRIAHASLDYATPISKFRCDSSNIYTDVDLRHVHVFGCQAFARIPDPRLPSKLSDRSEECIFLGVDSKIRGYILQRVNGGAIFTSRDIVVNELVFPKRRTTSLHNQFVPNSTKILSTPIATPTPTTTQPAVSVASPELRRSKRGWHPSGASLRTIAEANLVLGSDDHLETQAVESAMAIFNDPPHRGVMLNGPHCDEFIEGEKEELEALKRNNTWTVVDIPPGVKPISCRWVYKYKLHKDNTVKQHKCRLVARGFEQIFGLNYHETFAAVALTKSFRALMAITVPLDWFHVQLDVNNAFLFSRVDEPVHMRFPPGYPGPRGKCLLLLKSIYGLKQAGRNWAKSFQKKLLDLGFVQLKTDNCVFVLFHSKGRVIISVHVDDVGLHAETREVADFVIDSLSSYFSMKDPEPLGQYLGMDIEKQEDGSYLVHQRAYIERMLERYNMENANCAPTPAPPKHVFTKRDPDSVSAKDKPYRSLIGSLLYASICTRPDIAQAVNVLAQFNEDPTQEHWTAAKRVLRYLKGTKHQGIVFKKLPRFAHSVEVKSFSDADWAQDKDSRKSRTGLVIYINGSPAIWLSKKQATHALSSCEAELIAITEAIKELLWLRNFLTELKVEFTDPIDLFIDNQAAIALSRDPVNHSASKHIELRYWFILEAISNGFIRPVYVPTGENIADLFTKSPSIAIFRKFAKQLLS